MILKGNISMRKNQAGAFYAQTGPEAGLGRALHSRSAKRQSGEKFRVLHNFCG